MTRTFACTSRGCSKSFKKKSKLERHILSHSSAKSFVCPACNHSFKRKDHLKRHSLSHDPEGKTFMCPHLECTAGGFVDSYHLKRHIACVHDAPIKCMECGITFEKKWLLLKHRHITHGEIVPFTCEICGKDFYTSAHYHEHMQREGDKKAASLSSPSSARHKRLHPENSVSAQEIKKPKEKVFYKCPHESCGAYLSTQSNLKVHIQKHHERKGVQHCEFEGCSASYLHKKSLKEHMRRIHNLAS